MGENVKVIVRCRPMNRKESNMKCKNVVQVKDCAVTLENSSDPSAPSKVFTYDSAYDSNSKTESIYNEICYPLVESVLEGYNGTIFAYGQTGCGKSHTMQGPDDLFHYNGTLSAEQSAQRGIISRAFEHIFEGIAVANDVRYLALVSYLEIYNENIRDLLFTSNEANLVLKEIPGEGVTVQNLTTHAVHSVRDCEELLVMGAKNRMVGATQMNAGSSRSHSIFTVSLEMLSTACPVGGSCIKKGKLNLVDLAGSERQAKTGATGDRLKEATKINLSLSALGNVISALVDGRNKHIPYRDSKLTRLLQDSLGGNTKTLMIACISPAAFNYDETLSTLRYASRAKNISNKPIVNEDPKDALVREYQEEIMRLKTLLQNNEKVVDSRPAIDLDWVEKEKLQLKTEYENEAMRLKMEHEAQKVEKQELQRHVEKLKGHYEKQLEILTKRQEEAKDHNNNTNVPVNHEEILHRIEMIKASLLGGERANDLQLKEKRYKKKMASQRKLSALAEALGRIEQSRDRDLLKEHYTDIHQELQAKTEAYRAQKKKVNALECEISDLQAEFQLDRADYLETIRKLERNLKFQEQMIEKVLPLVRKEGKFWDIEAIKSHSEWNDDTKKWKLPEDPFSKLCLLPDIEQRKVDREVTSLTAPGRLERSSSIISIIELTDKDNFSKEKSENNVQKKANKEELDKIVSTYFRPKRVTELMQQNSLRDVRSGQHITKLNRINSGFIAAANDDGHHHGRLMNKTWSGGASFQNIVQQKIFDDSPMSRVFRPTAALARASQLN